MPKATVHPETVEAENRSQAVPDETPAPGRPVSGGDEPRRETASDARGAAPETTGAPQDEATVEPEPKAPDEEILVLVAEMREDAEPAAPESNADPTPLDATNDQAQADATDIGGDPVIEIAGVGASTTHDDAAQQSDAEPWPRADAPSTDLVPVLSGARATVLAKREADEKPAILAAEQLEPILRGAASGAPVRLETLTNQRLILRVTASIWARPEIVTERRTGCAPIGPVVESAEAAEAALAPLADDELSRGRGLQALRERMADDPWTSLTGLQGDDFGPLLAETRSVVSRCPDCAGAGGFACIDCEGTGRKECTACHGTGRVEQSHPSLKGVPVGLNEGKVALDPKRAWTFVMEQISSGGAAGEVAERSAASDRNAGRRDHADSVGAAPVLVECASCAGAGERRCSTCSGSGRVTCAPCAGTGFLTEIFSGRVRYERSLHIALSTGDANELAPSGATDALRAAWDDLVKSRAFEPQLVSFQSSGFAAQAVFEAEITLTRLRAIIGAKSPRLHLDFWAMDEPMMLLDPPKALDTLHRRAVDQARLASREGRRQVAGALSDIACGRAALRAAARRERTLPPGAFGPLASDAENARMLELARASHGSVGWREERQVWTLAALLAAPAGWLAGQSLSEPATAAVRPIAAAFAPVEAAAAPGVWETLGAVWSLFVATAPFVSLWLLAGLAAAWMYQRTTRRTLGFARSRSATRVFLGSAPLFALATAVFFYGFGLTIGAPPPGAAGADPATPAKLQAAAVATEPSTPRRSVATPSPRPAAKKEEPPIVASAFGGGRELAAFEALDPVDREWRGNGYVGAIAAMGGETVLSMRCEARTAVFRLEIANPRDWPGAPHADIRWSTERARLKARGVSLQQDRRGVAAPEWRASFAAIRALRRDRSLEISWSVNGSRGVSDFRLVGSSDVLQRILNNC